MEHAGIPTDQVVVRSCATLVAAMAVLVATSFAANRWPNRKLIDFGNALALGISNAIVLLGAVFATSSLTALILRRYVYIQHYEIFAAICFVGGAVGFYAGIFGSLIARNVGGRLAGAPANRIELHHVFRIRSGTAMIDRQHTGRTHTGIDWWYSVFNKAACVLLIVEIGACLWHDAPNWFLFAISLAIGSATVIAAALKPTSISPEALKSDANAWLCVLVGFTPLALALRAMYRFELVDRRWPLIIAIAVGLPLAFMVARLFGGAKGTPIRSAILGAFLCYSGPGALIWSGILFANAMITPIAEMRYRVEISGKHEQRGKYAMQWINAANPPDLNGIRDFQVDRLTYDRLTEGGDACIEVWRGSLSLRWYQVAQCSHLTPK